MTTSTTGLLRGTTIELEDPVPEMDGKRVRVVLEPLDEEPRLTAEEQRQAWREWIERGPQGPIEDAEDTDVP
jgi:hypothetical protein